jgi:hypothetical protein
MKNLIYCLAVISLCTGAASAQNQPSHENAANKDITKLVQAGIPDTVIMAKIRELKLSLDRSADSLIALKNAGASANVLEMMFEQEIALNAADAALRAGTSSNAAAKPAPSFAAIPTEMVTGQNPATAAPSLVATLPPMPAAASAIPAKPVPPAGAALSTQIPPMGPDGIMATPNRNLTPDESVWHFRAAMNVAALNCIGPAWSAIAPNYNKMLEMQKAGLAKNNLSVDTLYRKRHAGTAGLRVRDTTMTELFNYFALPTVRDEFCTASLALSQQAAETPPEQFAEFATKGLASVDALFVSFFAAFNEYQNQLKDWNSKYSSPMPSNPTP